MANKNYENMSKLTQEEQIEKLNSLTDLANKRKNGDLCDK